MLNLMDGVLSCCILMVKISGLSSNRNINEFIFTALFCLRILKSFDFLLYFTIFNDFFINQNFIVLNKRKYK
jgi:hypothetical protein